MSIVFSKKFCFFEIFLFLDIKNARKKAKKFIICTERLFQALQKATDASQCLIDMLCGVAIGSADKPLAALTECRSGNDGNTLGIEQSLAELV